MSLLTIDVAGEPRFVELEKDKEASIDAAFAMAQQHGEHIAGGYGQSCLCEFALVALRVAAGLPAKR